MDFKQTSLWKAAFSNDRDDATADEQARLANCYIAMRERASALTKKIAVDLPHMTIHDVTHLDALWEMASIVCGNNISLNPAEAFVFGGAVLLHDAAMSLAAFPGGVAELRQTIEWRDLYARYSGITVQESGGGSTAAENRATQDALRLLHAKHAENLPKISWGGPQGQAMYIIEDQQVRNFYGAKMGRVAYSHWWSITKVEEELASTLGALPGVTSCTVDLLRVACLLRVADAMHLDQRRAVAFEFALIQPTGSSADHWKFQDRMAKPFVKGDALVYTAEPPFDVDMAEAWWTAFDALQVVDRELRDVDRVLTAHQKTVFIVRRVDKVHSPRDLSTVVGTIGWVPVDSTIRVTDIPKIVATLGGSKLYGTSMAAPIRELIQNGLDSITARRKIQSRPLKWGELHVILELRTDGYWFCVEDNGVGMSDSVLTGPLIDFGNSFWRSSLAMQEFPGLALTGMKARGKYGIGFFSVFMLGDHVRVITRRYDRDVQSARVLEFRNGLGSRPNLLFTSGGEVPLDGGTRVEVKLHINPMEPDGLLHRENIFQTEVIDLAKFIAEIAPATDVTIKVVQNSQLIGTTIAGDWLEIDNGDLIERISQSKHSTSAKSWLDLSQIRDEEGKIYGRACINPTSGWSKMGLITVDGLAANKIHFLAGILLGIETTASRNSAQPIVPASVLASWASEQALVFENAPIPDAEKAQAAEIVAAIGGDVAGLPIIWYQDYWMSISEFNAAVRSLERVLIYEGDISHEDDDQVTKREFQEYFIQSSSISRTFSNGYQHFTRAEWLSAITQGNGTTPLKIVEQAISAAWKSDIEFEEEVIVVGSVNGCDIEREVRCYTCVKIEETSSI